MVVDTPGIIENRKQQERGYPFNEVRCTIKTNNMLHMGFTGPYTAMIDWI